MKTLPYRLAIFDFDGTLADSSDWFLRNFDDMADRFGFRRIGEGEIEKLRHLSNREIVRYLRVPAWKLPGIARHMREKVAREADSIHLFEGVGEMLGELSRAGIRTAIVSSNSEENVRRILGTRNAARIDLYECSASLFGKARKLKRAVARSGIPASEALAIGDETRDIEAARKAGIAAAAACWGYAAPEALRRFGPDLMLGNMADIVRAFSPVDEGKSGARGP